MPKTLLVGLREFRQHIRSRGFFLSTLGLPLFMLALLFFTGLTGGPPGQIISPANSDLRFRGVIGYVDRANLIRAIPSSIHTDQVRRFFNAADATHALQDGEIVAYYDVPADYRETGRIQRVSQQVSAEAPDKRAFNWILVHNLMPNASTAQLDRLLRPFNADGPAFVNVSPSGKTGARSNGVTWLPFLVSIAIMSPLFTNGSYLFQSLIQEKSNRVMEILLISLRPRQLLVGKLLGLGALTLVQYALWTGLGLLASATMGIDFAQSLAMINMNTGSVTLVVLYGMGGYVLYATLMAGIGALAPDIENSRAWIFALSLPMLIPLYLWTAIVAAPNSLLSITLSLFPFSAPVTMLMRITVAAVPAWQVGSSLLLLALAGAGMIWLMGACSAPSPC